jgi:hypothetical protein
VTRAVVLLVPKVDVQCMILVPWEGIALRTILAPLVCHYGAVVGNCLSSKTSILTLFFYKLYQDLTSLSCL